VKHHILPGDYTICLFPSVHGLMKHRILTGYNRSSLPTGIFYTTKLHLSSGTAKWHRFCRKPRSHGSYFSEFLAENETHSTRLHRATVEGEFDSLPPLSSSEKSRSNSYQLALVLLQPQLSPGSVNTSVHRIITQLQIYLQLGRAMAACDGSYFETKDVGVTAWIISSTDGSSRSEEGDSVPGLASKLNS